MVREAGAGPEQCSATFPVLGLVEMSHLVTFMLAWDQTTAGGSQRAVAGSVRHERPLVTSGGLPPQ